jgi:hypothetical protein
MKELLLAAQTIHPCPKLCGVDNNEHQNDKKKVITL